ncbi:hypothetical protein, partial [Candidatus Phycosocius bacilliformis]|uniref:hypothetical protein n=1 Tax=Candidatus Phycosocius bacilliformis TaxID=1445552 RepID=UPI001EDEA4F5
MTTRVSQEQLRLRFGDQIGHQSASRQKSSLNDVIPAEAKRSVGTPSRMCGTRSRIGFAVRDDSASDWFFHLEPFGETCVSPKRMDEFERDIWVVKCRFSSKTDRTATQQSCALDH